MTPANPLDSSRRLRCAPRACGWLLGLLALSTGCETYTPRPLDVEASRRALDARSAASAEVAELARRLAAEESTDPSEFDAEDGLTLPEAEVVALVFNPELRLARMQAGVAKATADTAGIWEDPVTGINLNDVLQHANSGFSMGAEISFTIPISGRLDAEKERAGAAYAAHLALVQAAEWDTRMELRRAWAAWSSTRQRVAMVAETLDAVSLVADIADRLEAAGEMPRVEARLLRIERATVKSDLTHLRAKVAEREVAVKRILGLAPWASIRLVPDTVPPATPVDLATLRDRMVAQSPLIAAHRALYEVAEKALAVEIRKQYPDIEIGPSYNTDGNEDLTLGVRFPLPLWNHNQQGVAVADAGRTLERARFEATLERCLADLESAAVVYEGFVAQRRTLQEEIAPLVDLQASETRRIAELGEVNTLLLLQSLVQQLAARLSLIEAQESEWLARIQIAHLSGPEPRVAPPTIGTSASAVDSASPAASTPAPPAAPSPAPPAAEAPSSEEHTP